MKVRKGTRGSHDEEIDNNSICDTSYPDGGVVWSVAMNKFYPCYRSDALYCYAVTAGKGPPLLLLTTHLYYPSQLSRKAGHPNFVLPPSPCASVRVERCSTRDSSP